MYYVITKGGGGSDLITFNTECNHKQGSTSVQVFLSYLFKPGSGPDRKAAIHLIAVDFSCANSVLNVRQIVNDGDGETMVYQTEGNARNTTHGLVNLVATLVTLSFHAPRRSCRININSRAVSIKGEHLFTFPSGYRRL